MLNMEGKQPAAETARTVKKKNHVKLWLRVQLDQKNKLNSNDETDTTHYTLHTTQYTASQH